MMTQAWSDLSEAVSACGVVRRGLLPVNKAWHGTTVLMIPSEASS